MTKTVHVQNPAQLQVKIKAMQSDGVSQLHVVSDFDRTLTCCFLEGKRIPSTIAFVREGGYLTPDYPQKAFALHDEYRPIEIDDTLSLEFRAEKMKEWWTKHKKLLIESGMNRAVIEDILEKWPKILRQDTDLLLKTLHEKQIPLLIFSSGIGNFIRAFLEKNKQLTLNVHILSNTLIFNEKGEATGYENETIHVFNKSETQIENPKYRALIEKRKNVILLGDSLGDLGMVNDLDTKTIIKIGFLNENIEERLPLYKEKFDLVITHDGPMTPALDILKEILKL